MPPRRSAPDSGSRGGGGRKRLWTDLFGGGFLRALVGPTHSLTRLLAGEGAVP